MKVTHRSAHSEMVFLHAIHWGRQFHALRSGILQSGAENPATPRQPVRHEVVTHVLGTWCYLSVRAGQFERMAEGGSAGSASAFFGLGRQCDRKCEAILQQLALINPRCSMATATGCQMG